ncbi:alpha/beta fold hydrolase, partial [Mesorhizobium retamae]
MLKSALTMFALFCLTPAVAGEPVGTARNGAVELAYWLQGPQDGIPLVIINGQGAATRPGDGFTAALAAAGVRPPGGGAPRFRVTTFDNRDSARSTMLGAAGAPPSMEDIMAGHPPAYDLSDMAADTVAVLDAAGVRRAHVVGHSLGGMVAQMLAASHPDRVLSLVSVSSTSG